MRKSREKSFVDELLLWNSTQNDRKMPWKGEKNPYHIWLSEIILQQTRVEQGLQYYLNFLKHYPSVEKLAQSADNDVFKLWEGLGYYSRCRNLLFTARYIAKELEGKFPDNYNDIIKLKGVGSYTAAAIASFAYNEPKAVLDGNVFRVLSRHFNIDTPIDTNEGKKYFTALASKLLPVHKAALYNQAIMDFGATVCKPKPLCEICPLQDTCLAYQESIQTTLPVKSKKLVKITRYFQFVIAYSDNAILIRKRTEKDIWHGLHQFLMIETKDDVEAETFLRSKEFTQYKLGKYTLTGTSKGKQQLTHQTIKARFIKVYCKKLSEVEGYEAVSFEALSKLAFPKLLQEQLKSYNL